VLQKNMKLLLQLACAALAVMGAEANAQVDVAQGKSATASSALQPASYAFDGNGGTRWESTHGVDPSWIRVDLGAPTPISAVVIDWEAANAAEYQIQGSNDDSNYTTLASFAGGVFGARTDTLAASGSYRYVRMNGTKRSSGNNWGYSIWSMKVMGTSQSSNRIQAEDYSAYYDTTAGNAGGKYRNDGVDIEVTGDTGGGYNVGWTDTGEWLEYQANVPAAGLYRIDSRVNAWGTSGITWTVDQQPGTTTSIAATQGWTTVQSGTVCLTGGSHVLRATLQAGGFNFNWFDLVKVSDSCGDDNSNNPPNFGPNVYIYDSTTPAATIQTKLDQTFAAQQTNQFGPQRYAFLFKPGTYAVDANLGFYTHVAGLGLLPDQTTINGRTRIEVDWLGQNGSSTGNATQNFWRSAENLQVNPPSGSMNWAAAQAVPFRRMHVNGNLFLSPQYGWASGGYFADSKIGNVYAQSQQQWFTRNSELTAFYDVLWNMVFVGTTGAPANTFPDPAATNVAQTPVLREKPFLYVDGTGKYNVFVPALRTNSVGTTWAGGNPAGTSLPISSFYIVRSDNGTAANINAALAQGKNLLFTPGVYHVNDTIRVTRADTVVLGIGLATLIPDGGVTALSVADVDGVKIAGLLFDAGTVSSPTLLQVGPSGASASHAANPTSLFDVFVRVGGTGTVGKAASGVTINSSNVIGDHFWVWRADHGDNVAWDINTSDNGVIVNGNDVTLYGLFVEHFQKYNVLWNGNGGRTYFFQNEIPYDVPNQAAWMNGTTKGYAAYKVADAVNTHEAWGMGSYSLFLSSTPPTIDHAYETPVKAGVKFHNISTVFLGAGGEISHVINNTGAAANASSYWQKVTSFP